MFKKILIALVLAIAVFLVVVALQPAEFQISRSMAIAAPPDRVFSLVNDFHQWEAWSPWAKLDPAMKTSYEGSASGEGSAYSWVGNKKVGEGRMTIVKSQPSERVGLKLEFLKPWKATNETEFTFVPNDQGTQVTWTMSGKNNFVGKAFCLFMNMEKMVGPDFEKGLAQMKAAAEAVPAPAEPVVN